MTTTHPISMRGEPRLMDALTQAEPWTTLGPGTTASQRARLALLAFEEKPWPVPGVELREPVRRRTLHLDDASYGALYNAATKWAMGPAPALRLILLAHLDRVTSDR